MRAPPTDSFRTAIFYPLIDRALSELNRRLSAENKEIMKGIYALTPKSSLFLQWEVLQPFANMYKFGRLGARGPQYEENADKENDKREA